MSGGGSAPTSQTVTQTTVPEYLRPYVEEMAGQARGLAQYEIESGYKPYLGQRFAGFAPMQAQAFSNVAGQQVSPQLTDASNIAFGAGTTGLQAGSQGAMLGQQAGLYGGMGAEYGALGGAIGSRGVEAAEQGFGAGQAYQQMATSPQAMQSYMSPYMQNVVEAQQREASRASDIQRNINQAQAVQRGAYGGSRQAIVEAERQRNLATQMGDIQAAGLQKAYQDAQQSQQFGANLGLQGLAQGYQGLQTGLAGTAQGISGAQAGLQGVQGAIGAGQYGLAGAGAATGAAQTLGGLGGQQFEQQMAVTDAMQKYGALQQQQQQQALDYQYQQYLAEQNLPYQQLAYFSDMIRGLPLSQSSTSVYGGQPDVASQLGGLALAGAGYAMRSAEGGQVKKYAAGGAVASEGLALEDVMGMKSKLRRLSDSQLAAYARTVKDAITLSAVQTELDRRSKMRQPYAQEPTSTTAQGIAQQAEAASVGRPRVGMAGGGIVALQPGGRPEDMPAFTGGEEFGVGAEMMVPGTPSPENPYDPVQEIKRGVEEVKRTMDAGPYANVPTGGSGAVTPPPPMPKESVPPQTIPTVDLTAAQGAQQQGQQQGQDRSGIMGASAPRFSTFEQFKSMLPKGEIDPAQQKILADMQGRLTSQMERAGKQEDNAIYDAMLMAGLAMMGGNSLADGIAKAAQLGGATYMASKKDAQKALDAAENSELAFRKYELEVMKGNEDAARKEFGAFLDYTAQLANIDAKYATANIRAGLDGKDYSQIVNNIETAVNKRFENAETQLSMIADPQKKATEAKKINDAKNSYRNELFTTAGIPVRESAAPQQTGTTNVMGSTINYTVE